MPQNKTQAIKVSVSPREQEELAKRASRVGLPLATWVRMILIQEIGGEQE